MEMYLNSTGKTPKKLDPTALASMGFDLIAGTLMSVREGKKNRELQEKLAKLSLKQQKELEERLQNLQGEVARQTAMYEAVALIEGAKLIDGQKTKQKILLGVLGGGVILLVALSIIYKRK